MFELHHIPSKTATGLMYIEQPRQVPWIKIDTHLRWLLILVDGVLSTGDLLAKGLPQVELRSFDQLETAGLISRQVIDSTSPAIQTPAPKKIALASARFDILDLILDASMQDFQLRRWIDQFEQSHSIDDLIATYQRFCAQVGQQHLNLQQQITTILAL